MGLSRDGYTCHLLLKEIAFGAFEATTTDNLLNTDNRSLRGSWTDDLEKFPSLGHRVYNRMGILGRVSAWNFSTRIIAGCQFTECGCISYCTNSIDFRRRYPTPGKGPEEYVNEFSVASKTVIPIPFRKSQTKKKRGVEINVQRPRA